MTSYQVDRVRWAKLSILEQFGNIGSEVGRALAARKRPDAQRTQAAIERALDLFAATSEELVRKKSPRLKELLRAREQFLNQFYNPGEPPDLTLEDYFMQFALAARLQKERQSAV